MTSDDDDDPQLRQLRAVWVSMRDEEPSDRGLSALMAAARSQAEQMTPRSSWWQRVLSSLRRPPVLALASVTVLLGGALFVAQRHDELAATTPEVAQPAAGSAASVTTPASPAEPLSDDRPEPAVIPAPATVAPSMTGATSGAAGPHKERGRDTRSSAADPRPTVDEATLSPARRRTSSDELNADRAVVAEEVSADVSAEAAPTPRASKAPLARQTAPSIEGEGRGAPAGRATAISPQRPTIAQLVQQCEAAAARGDCPAVRSLAARIASADPAIYKTRVRANPAVARCLD